MKRILIMAAACALLTACADSNQNNGKEAGTTPPAASAEVSDTSNFTSIQWLDSLHQDLPKVKEGQTVEILWRFKNTGDKPLVITYATASCGCTVAEKPEQPVAPGEEGVIRAKFDSKGRVGEQQKSVTVGTNTKETLNHGLSFSLEVEAK